MTEVPLPFGRQLDRPQPETAANRVRLACSEHLRGLEFGSPAWLAIGDMATILKLNGDIRDRSQGDPYSMNVMMLQLITKESAAVETQRERRNNKQIGKAYRAAETDFAEKYIGALKDEIGQERGRFSSNGEADMLIGHWIGEAMEQVVRDSSASE